MRGAVYCVGNRSVAELDFLQHVLTAELAEFTTLDVGRARLVTGRSGAIISVEFFAEALKWTLICCTGSTWTSCSSSP
jgi:hypothetical protein